MSKAPTYSQLPDVGDDVDSLRAWAKVATQIIRSLIGNGTGHANTTIVTQQGNATQMIPDGIRDGDLWIALPTRAGQTLQRSLWFQGKWVLLNGSW